MFYKQNGSKSLDPALFKSPTSEYRGTPFWAWNCKLEKEELLRQIDILKEMGFGGFHMHVRTGMDTVYLSDEHMGLVKSCVEKAKNEKMLAYLYDEDRWPSGAAGGIVTKDSEYRQRWLLFTPYPYATPELKEKRKENGKLLACYDIELDCNGCLASYRLIDENEQAKHEKWYAYVEISSPSRWFNNQTYINTLDKKAMDRFIDVTYEAYNRTVSDEFGKTVPSIFTDEPQFSRKQAFKFAFDKKDVTLPWSDDLPETFADAYGENLTAGIPELFWELQNGKVSLIRYHYHDHICDRFTHAFADNCGAWCREHGLILTGHMMEEPTLRSQTAALGEAMRSYRGFDIPGIDMLCAYFEYTTAKQAQSAVHQFGYEGMLSELYGVTNWDFDFRGHKLHGDWQAALGVTVRVPHLSWVSMAGEAKRDYPASISYQSPWWKEYRNVEDHFARINTAMTRGTPVVKVGVIHPVESYWLHWGPAEQTQLIRDKLEDQFGNVTRWLLFGSIDFDFISESLLPTLCPEASVPLQVGKMAYDAIIVPGCETLRSSTLERLEAFRAAGGRLIFMGDAPVYENAVPSERGKLLYEQSEKISFTRGSLIDALNDERTVELRSEGGQLSDQLLYQLRQDTDCRWLFIAHGKEPYNKDVSRCDDVHIRIKGAWRPTLYNTLDGSTEPLPFCINSGNTEILRRMYDYDSLLLRLVPTSETDSYTADFRRNFTGCDIKLPVLVNYRLSEPNVLLLDKAEYKLDGEPWQPSEEILRLDDRCREVLCWQSRKDNVVQPWVIPDEPIEHTLSLRFTVNSNLALDIVTLAIEDAEKLTINWNGTPLASDVSGWYVDKAIKTVILPGLKIGKNILTVTMPYGKRTNPEWAYLLGDFAVKASGAYTVLESKPSCVTFGSFTNQGFPFYGGNFTYCFNLDCNDGDYAIRINRYRGAMIRVNVDGKDHGVIIDPPYILNIGHLVNGPHHIEITLFGHRRNSFGPVHLTDLVERWIGPGAWRSVGENWTYDYVICEEGILNTPTIKRLEQ